MNNFDPLYEKAIQKLMSHARRSKGQPLFSWTPLKEPPFDLSFFLVCPFRQNAYAFFYEMVTRWLIPGKRMNALLQFAADFSLGREKYIGGEIKLRIETDFEFELLQKNLSTIATQIRLGVHSSYQACRILEGKGISSGEKIAFIQEILIQLIKRRPQDFDYDLLDEMQRFVVLCKDGFKQPRSSRLIARIICVHYLFRKALKLSREVYLDRQEIFVKLVRSQTGLGIIVGISFLQDHEVCREEHLFAAIQAIIPHAEMVAGSFFLNSDSIVLMYLEIKGGYSLEEERLLKEELPSELANRIEQRFNPLFMPQNEEEVMRSILILSAQLQHDDDLPQVMIEFYQQTEEAIEFRIILLRMVSCDHISIKESFQTVPTSLEYFHDRVKMLGPKEASVFRVRVSKWSFIRENHSIDLCKARQIVGCELNRVIGEFRDYNGGTLSKESELFEQLRRSLGHIACENGFLLENFFYSLDPPVMRSILPSDALKQLFMMFLEAEISGDQFYQIQMEEDSRHVYVVLLVKEGELKGMGIEQNAVAVCWLKKECIGLIFRDLSPQEIINIRLSIEEKIKILCMIQNKTLLI